MQPSPVVAKNFWTWLIENNIKIYYVAFFKLEINEYIVEHDYSLNIVWTKREICASTLKLISFLDLLQEYNAESWLCSNISRSWVIESK
jgi:hypothetical protein